jgi:hypothetical protein
MSSSPLRTAILRFRKPKFGWSDPKKSIGKFRGIKSGKLNCWEAEGPAKELFEQIKPHIKELLESACGPVPSSSFIHFDIFMFGETQASACPYIMFSCKHREPRINAVTAMRKSNILDHCPAGIHFGHWDYPPHLKDLRFLASESPYKVPYACALEENEQVSVAYSKEFSSTTRHYNLDTWRTLQLVGMSKGPAYQRTATIGAVVPLCGRRFYLAPAHVLSCQGDVPPEAAPEADSGLEGSDYELESFDYGNRGASTSHEAEYMSQYSLSPDSSDTDEDLDPNDESSTSDAKSDCLSPAEKANELSGNIFPSGYNAKIDPEDVNPTLMLYTYSEVELPSLQSDDFDYCLIEVDETKYPPELPDFSQENIGHLHSGSVDVVAATASGNVLTGVLSSRLSCIRAPNATRYIDVFSAQFEGSLRPGDSGAIVRDAASGVIYGHIIAGDTGSKTALIVPAVDVLNDIMSNSTSIETSSAEYSQSQARFSNPLSLQIIDHYGFYRRSGQSTAKFGSADYCSPAMPLECPEPTLKDIGPLPDCPSQGSKSNFNPAAIDPSICSDGLFSDRTDMEQPQDEMERPAERTRKWLLEDGGFRNRTGQTIVEVPEPVSIADPIGATSGILCLVTFALECSVSLYKTLSGFRSHPKCARDLLGELEALKSVLTTIGDKLESNSDVDLSILDMPLLRCGNVCKEFRQEVLQCASRSKSNQLSFRDWARLTYMGDNIDGFRDLLAGYKATITIALTDANL